MSSTVMRIIVLRPDSGMSPAVQRMRQSQPERGSPDSTIHRSRATPLRRAPSLHRTARMARLSVAKPRRLSRFLAASIDRPVTESPGGIASTWPGALALRIAGA
jgi:hypothetical protein